MSNFLSKSNKLRNEADEIINKLGLNNILNKYSADIFYTGSYYLNLMAWADLDISIILKNNPFDMNSFMNITKEIGLLNGVQKINFRNYLKDDPRPIPKGLYNGIYLDFGLNNWKIDLWAVDEKSIADSKKEMDRILRNIDDEKRNLILKVKNKILTSTGRTPPFSGYTIYKCVIDKGMSNIDDIIEFLK